MAGHSKWANIKFRKEAQDSKRGKLFTTLIREITVAAREGGPEISANARLRAAIDKALSGNMTRDTIDRAVQRGVGNNNVQDMETIRYEGYGPYGVAIMIDCMTDNRNRTVAEIRYAFSKHGGNLGVDGSVDYLFSEIAYITVSSYIDEEKLVDLAVGAGAEDIIIQEDCSVKIQTSLQHLPVVRDMLEQAEYNILLTERVITPKNIMLLDAQKAGKIIKLINHFKNLDDVQSVHTNTA